MTEPADPYEIPIVPGTPYEPPPTAPIPVPPAPVPYPTPPPAQPQPVYYQHPPLAPTWNPQRTAGNTVVVLVTLFGLFCLLPAVLCLVLGALGNLTK